MVMLKMRTEAWEAQKHPYFKDRLLGNEQLIRLYKLGKLTKEDVASVLGTSPDYTDWLINKWRVDIDSPSKAGKFSESAISNKEESPAIPLTADPIPTEVIKEIPTEVVKDVSPLNGSSETNILNK
jgi:hypothetical protein